MKKEVINLDNFQKISVRQLENKNQFVIRYNNQNNPCLNVVCFQSYATLICMYSPNENKLYINWSMYDYSKTTLKHLKIFINEYTPFNYINKADFTLFILNSENVILFNE